MQCAYHCWAGSPFRRPVACFVPCDPRMARHVWSLGKDTHAVESLHALSTTNCKLGYGLGVGLATPGMFSFEPSCSSGLNAANGSGPGCASAAASPVPARSVSPAAAGTAALASPAAPVSLTSPCERHPCICRNGGTDPTLE